MRVQVMGAGALGCLFGALIQLAGYDVVYVARGKQLDALRKGLRVSGLIEEELKVYATNKPEDADVTFVTVKAYDTEGAARALAKVDPGIVCSLQNGIGNEEILQKYCKRVVGGVTSYAANLKEYGHVIYAGEGYTYVGDLSGEISDDAVKIAEVLKGAGIRVEVVNDIKFRIWVKAAVNAAINPITALCRVKNGMIVKSKDLWKLAEYVAKECEEVMRRMGYEFDVAGEVRRVAEMTAENRSSMLQDVERGKRTEIDFINWAFVERGRELGVECRVNEVLTRLVRGIEVGSS